MPLPGSSRPHVLIVAEQWRVTQQELVIPTRETDLMTVATAYCDTRQLTHQGRLYAWTDDWTLVDYCRQCAPDLVLLDPVRQVEHPPTPTGLALACIAWQLHIPVVGLLHHATPDSVRRYDLSFPMCQHIVVFNGHCPVRETKQVERYSWDWWPMLSTSLLRAPDAPRPIAVSMPGRLPPGSDRERLVRGLRAGGVDVVTPGPDGELSTDAYREVLGQSQIVLNHASEVSRRAFETCLSGALLMDYDDNLTWRFFAPGTEYVPFEAEQEAFDRIQHYLAHEDERVAIAAAGHDRARSTYTASNWWKKLGFRVWRDRTLFGLS